MPIRIFVDQGHNPFGFNAGAEGFGLREQDITYMVGAYLADLLAADPRFDVATSRPNPTTVLGYNNSSSLRQRVDMANSWGADYFISIHTNANENPAVNGTEGYVYSLNSVAAALASSIVNEIVRRVGTKNNGVIENRVFYVLRRTNMPAVLVELAYITNYEDAMLLKDAQYQFAYGIYVGLLNYLGLPQIF
ncbi:MAG: N-acetylmuramoyl-L-alanine amidase [Lachnospiraceae bacterium]|nr:N-acetylmuramoyl-L-alanine amidase [Lachnospiraceae bacterium]